MIMNTIDDTHGADIIGMYAKSTGKAFDKTRADVIEMFKQMVNADITDVYSSIHVGLARLVAEAQEDMHVTDEKCDKTYATLALIMSIAAIMQTQHTIHSGVNEINDLLKDAPNDIRVKGAILLTTPSIKERRLMLSELVGAMVDLFMSNLIKNVGQS